MTSVCGDLCCHLHCWSCERARGELRETKLPETSKEERAHVSRENHHLPRVSSHEAEAAATAPRRGPPCCFRRRASNRTCDSDSGACVAVLLPNERAGSRPEGGNALVLSLLAPQPMMLALV